MCGKRLLPRGVSEYSTFGGISAYIFRLIRPSVSRFFSVSESTFGDMSGIALPMALKRVASLSARTQIISRAHLPEKRDMIFLTGQDSIRVNFIKFSWSGNAFIINFTYQRVSISHFGEFLFLKTERLNFALSIRKRLTVAKLVNVSNTRKYE